MKFAIKRKQFSFDDEMKGGNSHIAKKIIQGWDTDFHFD